jgi:outer membrane biosynthesis protein TonB
MTTPTTTVTTHGVFTQNWAIMATEAAAVLFVFALTIAVISWLGRRKRINAARTLLKDRSELAETAAETFNTHVQALASGRTLTPDELDDYEQRSIQVVNDLVEPWLAPSAEHLRHAVREIMTIRHNDLHQIAAIFRQQHAAEPSSDESTTDQSAVAPQVEQLQVELAASQKAEAERSAQLAEALKSVSIIVGEYGRKFGVEADFRVPQILRALIYLQSMDRGMNQQEAAQAADASLVNSIHVIEEEVTSTEDLQTTAPAPSPEPAAKLSVSEVAAVDSIENIAEIEPEPTNDVASPKQPDVVSTEAVTAKPQELEPATATPQAPEVKAEAAPAETTTAKTEEPKKAPAEPKPEPSPAVVSENTPATSETGDKPNETDEVQIDLDAIELPEKVPDAAEFNLDLDDIDALLDAEITRQQAKATTAPPKLPDLDDDELDLSKKP